MCNKDQRLYSCIYGWQIIMAIKWIVALAIWPSYQSKQILRVLYWFVAWKNLFLRCNSRFVDLHFGLDNNYFHVSQTNRYNQWHCFIVLSHLFSLFSHSLCLLFDYHHLRVIAADNKEKNYHRNSREVKTIIQSGNIEFDWKVFESVNNKANNSYYYSR